jgi:hypothetical protein
MGVNLAQASASAPLAAQDVFTLRQVFETLTPESCPYSFNFHMHTIYSDGKLQPQELIDQAIDLGLQGLAITDHHSVRGYQAAQQWLEQRQHDHSRLALRLWTGMEINADLLNTEVHVLAYAFDSNHAAIQPYAQEKTAKGDAYHAAQVIAAIHAAGGLAVLAHPARYRRSPAELIPAAACLGIDGIETYYAYNNPTPWQPSPQQTQEVLALGLTYNLLNTCGTDTHGMSLLQRL